MDYPFCPEIELQDAGIFPAVPQPYGGGPGTPMRRFNTPISPRENVLRMCRGEQPLWIPNINQDFNFIQPMVLPDNEARTYGGVDCFGIQWQYEPLSNAAMVRPGTRRLSDITRWREELLPDWPDLNRYGWKENYQEIYAPVCSPERATMIPVLNGYFERLADLTSFDDAFCYLLEEPEAVEDLYTALDAFHIQLFRILREVYHADVITFHDDMGSQRDAFMSPETFRALQMPHYQKLTRAAHEMGLFVNFHSCGNLIKQMPAIAECGFDFWEGQDNCNDKQRILEQYGDRLGQVGMLLLPEDLPQAEFERAIRERVEAVAPLGRYLFWYFETNPRRRPDGYEMIYRCSRTFFCGLVE